MTRGAAAVTVVVGLLAALGAYFVYPLFSSSLMAVRQTSGEAPNILVIQEGDPGGALSVDIRAPSINQGPPVLILEEENLATTSVPDATTYVGYQTHVGGGEYSYEPIGCSVDRVYGGEVGEVEVGTTGLNDVWKEAFSEGVVTWPPTGEGEVSWFRWPSSVESFRLICDLPEEYAFKQDSLSNWQIYLPGTSRFGMGGAEAPIVSYSIDRDPSDFIVQASQQPSFTYQHSFVWWQRHFERLAPQGLWFTISSPALQQEHAYRLFIAGALLGVAASSLVSGVVGLIAPVRRSAR